MKGHVVTLFLGGHGSFLVLLFLPALGNIMAKGGQTRSISELKIERGMRG